ncbi:MAG: uracil-DNA glycosylase [Ferrimicrobium sp.]
MSVRLDRSLSEEIEACRRCNLGSMRLHAVVGEGAIPSQILFVGEAPGQREDELGRPFVGRSGALLDRLIAEELGIARNRCYIANVVKCRPPSNRNPLVEEIAACAPFLQRQIDLVQPRAVVLLGRVAVAAVLADTRPLVSVRNQRVERDGRSYFATYHPAAGLRGGARVVTEMRVDFARVALWMAEAASDV